MTREQLIAWLYVSGSALGFLDAICSKADIFGVCGSVRFAHPVLVGSMLYLAASLLMLQGSYHSKLAPAAPAQAAPKKAAPKKAGPKKSD
mmetsp:Transcript_21161/g.72878  ORF Transcript_21161/g.72878 Transcript_21161/m.72878 type:complete len:90 (-) Transcript_21161:229-498(-)